MTQTYTTLISASELAQLVAQQAPLRIFDCRARLGAPEQGGLLFRAGHIQGALQADLDAQLADPPNTQGRHPLPPFEQWLGQVQRWGLQPEEQVVVYDDAGGQMAARAWWMFRWLGHEASAVLDGGLAQWQQPLQSGNAAPVSTSDYQPQPALTRLWQVDEVLQNLQSTEHTLVDARSQERFRGEQEPIDPVAGHIPHAVCLPCSENLGAEGLFKTPAQLRERFASITTAHTVCYCGSGVTATHNILAMRVAGLAEPALYADSWSGWITDTSRAVATGDGSAD